MTERATCSGEQSTSQAIKSGACLLTSVLVITDGTNDAVLIIYDNTAASGTVVFEMTVSGSDHQDGIVYVHPKIMSTGIYCSISGTNASYVVDYVSI